MTKIDELTEKYRQKLVKKNRGNKFLYFFLQILTALVAIASLVTYLINRHGESDFHVRDGAVVSEHSGVSRKEIQAVRSQLHHDYAVCVYFRALRARRGLPRLR